MIPVVVTHFYAVVATSTYVALKNSPELMALAFSEERAIVAGDRHWTGFYVIGERTYMEFFDAAEPGEEAKLDDAGLALTVEAAGGADEVAARWRSITIEPVGASTVERTLESGRVPWFRSVAIEHREPAALETWLMEIDPDYLVASHPGTTVGDPLGRKQYLSWSYAPERPLRDVIGLTVVIGAPEATRLARELIAIGWTVDRRADGFVARGPDFALTVFEATQRTGIQAVVFSVAPPMPTRRVTLGEAELFLDGDTGRLVLWSRP